MHEGKGEAGVDGFAGKAHRRIIPFDLDASVYGSPERKVKGLTSRVSRVIGLTT